LFYDGEDGNGPPVPLGASCPSCEPASPAAESEESSENTPEWCARWRGLSEVQDATITAMEARIAELEGIAEKLAGDIRVMQTHYDDRGTWSALDRTLDANLTEYAAYRQKHGGK